jgi:uncharacterized linocin/CFP29 family protein
MISFDSLQENTNPRICSFRMLQDTKCKRQIDDWTFEETGDIVRTGEVYDGEIVVKQENQFYLFLGYDVSLGYEVYIPISWNSNSNRVVNITEA